MTDATILNQIVNNIEELKVRCNLNQATIENMKAQGLRSAMYKDNELEISRISGMIDTYASCHQMITNK